MQSLVILGSVGNMLEDDRAGQMAKQLQLQQVLYDRVAPKKHT